MENTASSIDLTELLKKIDSQNETLKEVQTELKKANERAEKAELETKKKEAEEEKAEQARIEKGELTTDEKILKSLQELSASRTEQDKLLNNSLEQMLKEYKTGASSISETKEEIKKLVAIEQNSSDTSKEQSNLVATYALVLVPVFIAFYLTYKFFKQFI